MHEQHPASEAPQMHLNPDGTTRPETEEERIARVKERESFRARLAKIQATADKYRMTPEERKDFLASTLPGADTLKDSTLSKLYTDYRPTDRVLFTDAQGDHHSARVNGRNDDDILITIEDDDSSINGNTFYALTSNLIMVEKGSGHGPAFEPAARHQPAELDAEELFAGILIDRPAVLREQAARKQAGIPVAIQRLHTDARIPTQAQHGDAGYDLHALHESSTSPGGRSIVGTGIAVAIPHGFVGYIKPRSGLAARHGIDVLGGVIDAGYRGEIKVILHNTGDQMVHLGTGDRIAQLVIQPVASVAFAETDTLPDSDRAAGGFGSTGQ
ncbi:deoxyuridine triphosphatase [Arthrobacter phage Ottawa]|nr:deoxyuridine triphosphatase [Arthrobacter phage Kharcho]WIC89250.1 deoxyuridine triphosphatase [Arthrobacter phage Ottawa]